MRVRSSAELSRGGGDRRQERVSIAAIRLPRDFVLASANDVGLAPFLNGNSYYRRGLGNRLDTGTARAAADTTCRAHTSIANDTAT